MTVYRASWVLPIAAAPLRGGWVSVEGGRITGLGTDSPRGATDLGPVAVLPALVNSHTHLELSYLEGVVPPARRMVDWIRALMAERRRYPDPQDPAILGAARRGIQQAWRSGTGLVGDISNTLVTAPLLREAGMPARLFYELLGFVHPDPVGRVASARTEADALTRSELLEVSLAPHAPYSVSPGLFRAIRRDLDVHPDDLSTVHLAESPEEVEFTMTGGGAWREVLEELGAWNDAWTPPAASPVSYLQQLGVLDSRVLVVHAVQCGPDDVSRLKRLGVTVVSCPRSNRYVGAGDPPLAAMYAADIPIAFGTDSLASVSDLNLFGELAAARRIAPAVPARELLRSATLTGSRALGFGREFGSIETGKRAALIVVRLPDHLDDVEEYLVSCIEPDAIAWLDGITPNTQ